MSWHSCYNVLMIVSCLIGVNTDIIRLTPADVHVKENSSATLTCSRENEALVETRWMNSQISQDANLAFANGKCFMNRFLLNNDLFGGVCNGDGTYSVVLKRIDRSQHGAEWKCRESNPSNKAVIYVTVPATSVTLSQPDKTYMIEDQTEQLICNTTACRPDPRVQWYLRNSTTRVKYNLTQFSTHTYTIGTDGLKAVKSILNFKQNRTVNDLYLYCEVRTQSEKADVTSRDIIVNITYPPNKYPQIQGIDQNIAFRVIERDTNTFVCTVTGGNPHALLRWNCFKSDVATLKTNGNIVSSTIEWTSLRGYNTCSCEAYHLNNWKRLTIVTVDVQYPPAEPLLTIGSKVVFGDIQIIRNNTLQVACKSESNPISNYTWIGPGINNKDGDTLKITNVNTKDQGLYKCITSNRMTRHDNSYKDGRNSSEVNLVMLYSPGTPKFRFENKDGRLLTSNVLNVVKKDTFTIYCDVDGNPAPSVTWENNVKNPSLRITNILTDITRTCTAKNVMKETANDTERRGTSSATLSFNVLYPPDIPTINVSNVNGETVYGLGKTVSIIELETIYLTCLTNSKPMPKYQWVNDKSSEISRGNKVTFKNITRSKSRTYFCNVENEMIRSNGTVQHGKNSSIITLNILYPATVNKLENRSVVEGSQLEKHCPVIGGNPSNSTLVWSRLIDQSRWNNKLLIRNVSRNDDSDYTCSAITDMFPTIGSQMIIVKNQSFHLNVFFQSEIKSFSLSTSMSDTIVVINDTDDAPLLCIAAANPPSNLIISNSRGDSILEIQNRNIARHTLSNTSYIDAGEYTCTGRNNYTKGLSARSHLILIIRNLPRPSSGDSSIVKVATILHVNITLQFTAWNYLDEPNKTVFSWLKENVSISDNGSKYIIRTDGLQTNFTIRNTTRHDLGIYKVNVKNSVGEYIHYYDLKTTDKPDPPIDFQVITDTITDDSATLTWSPGFNGGFQQTFVILYRIKNDMIWLKVSINDTGNGNMNYTLDDLTSMHEYDIEMFAMNKEGKSAPTERLRFETKALQTLLEPDNLSSSVNYGLVVGLPIVTIVIISVLGLCFILYKRRFCQGLRTSFRKNENHIDTVPSNTYQNLTDSRSPSNERENEYEKMRMAEQGHDHRAQLSESTQDNKTTMTYQKLNTEQRDLNLYSQLHTSLEKEEIKTGNADNLREEKESAIYINMKI